MTGFDWLVFVGLIVIGSTIITLILKWGKPRTRPQPYRYVPPAAPTYTRVTRPTILDVDPVKEAQRRVAVNARLREEAARPALRAALAQKDDWRAHTDYCAACDERLDEAPSPAHCRFQDGCLARARLAGSPS